MPVYQERKKHPYGNRVVFCGGKLHASDDWKRSLFLTFIVVFATSLLCSSTIDYSSFPEASKTGEVNPGWIAAACINVILAVCSLVTLFLCVFVEPGIIPPECFYEQSGLPNPDPVPENFEDLDASHWSRKVTVALANGETMEIEEQICRTCRIWRPARSGHDWMDDVCIEEFDHKCTVVGAAIGKRNFGYFYMFNLFTSILAVSLIGTVAACYAICVKWDALAGTKADSMNQWRFASGILVILCAVIGGIFTFQFAIRYTVFSCQGVNAKDVMGWRHESRELAKLARRDKTDCQTCIDKSCVISLPESRKPY